MCVPSATYLLVKVSVRSFVTWEPIALMLDYQFIVASTFVQKSTKTLSLFGLMFIASTEMLQYPILPQTRAPCRSVHESRGEIEGGETDCGETDGYLGEIEEEAPYDDDSKRLAAFFLLKTRKERKVTQTALNGIVQDLRGLWRDAMGNVKVIKGL